MIAKSAQTGKVFVTPTEYGDGAAARSGLALPRTPTGYFEVPGRRLSGLQGPRVVEPSNGLPGGGIEYWVEHAVGRDRTKVDPILMPREKFLTVYDYGQGGVWRILMADSREQIERELPQLRVLDGPPDWMTEAELAAVGIVDIDSKDDHFLNQLRRTA